MKKVIIVLAGIFLAFGIFYFLKFPRFDAKKNVPTPIKPKLEKTIYNFLLLGYGGGVHDGTYLTDTMMVAHIDTKIKKVTLFSIPRDLWVKLSTKSGADFHTKINAVYQLELFPKNYPDLDQKYMGTLDDASLIKTVVTQITGLPIDGYVSIDFQGFTKAVDILGGIDVNIEKSFIDSEYPIDGKEKDLCGQDEIFKKAEPYIIPPFDSAERQNKFAEDPKIEEFARNATSTPELAFPCRYEKLEFKKGVTHMDGATALKYARSRHSGTDGGDFNRARRQQQIIEAVKDKVLTIGFLPKIIPLINEFQKDIKTDIGLDVIKKFISIADKTKEYKINTFVISDQNVLKNAVSDDRQYILISKEGKDSWNEVKKLISDTIIGVTPTPIASASATLKSK